ncbi:MAG TPA: 3-hydroxyacyl-CoA dehydrogenase family protein [Chitinophagaceae bacterium]|nr:3-hydroxyacyl-CoA dehydrogenase family protein [Chitinophagaceae bacterium]
MKIILLANDEQREELTAQQPKPEAELVWLADLSSLKDIAADACIDLLFAEKAAHLEQLKRLQTSFLIINSISKPSNEWLRNCVRINGWNTFLKRSVIEATGPHELQQKTGEIFSLFHKQVDWVADITGFVSLRVIASIINEAYFALDEKVSTKEEIDTAMKLGTNYPYGPFEWSEKIGIKNICGLLEQLSIERKRYTPSALLKKEAAL